MRIYIPSIDIGDEEGFTQENDLFARKQFAVGLTNLVSRITDPIVIALDGQWGSGKTTFSKMWAGELRKAGFPVVYFDAFQHDYMPDAFTALAGQIVSLVEEQKKSADPKAKAFLQKATAVGKILVRSSLKIGVRAATMGALEASDIEAATSDFSRDASKEVSEIFDKNFGELLTKQRDERELIEKFRLSLGELPELLDKSEDPEHRRPLVFFIDELDRCRPTFALEILERVKHFFSVPNVHFVMTINFSQLCSSVSVRYGAKMDADIYLQKFFHFIFPISTGDDHLVINEKYISHLINAHDLPKESGDLEDYIRELIKHVAETKSLSLRAIERIMSRLALALAFTPRPDLISATISIGLVILQTIDSSLYIRAKKGCLSFSELAAAIGLPKSDDSWAIGTTIRIWRYCLDGVIDDDRDIVRRINSNYGKREKVVPACARNVVDRLAPRN